MNPTLIRTLTIAVTLSCLQLGCAGKPPATLGPKEGGLAACLDKPNCVVSMSAADETHFVEPLTYAIGERQAYALLRQVVAAQDRTAIVEQGDRYLRAEFKSRLFRFVDDAEFYFPPDAPVIHVRSASRIGHSDLGVNRKRIESIRRQFDDAVNRTVGGN